MDGNEAGWTGERIGMTRSRLLFLILCFVLLLALVYRVFSITSPSGSGTTDLPQRPDFQVEAPGGQEVHQKRGDGKSLSEVLATLEQWEVPGATILATSSEMELSKTVSRLYPECMEKVRKMLPDVDPFLSRVIICEGSINLSDAVGGEVPSWASAVAVSDEGLIALDADRLRPWPVGRLQATLTHEICHLALGQFEDDGGEKVRFPRWLDEGVAQWISEDSYLGTEEQLYQALVVSNLIPFHEIEHGFPARLIHAQLAYQQSKSFVRYLDFRFGEKGVREFLAEFARNLDVYVAFEAATGERWSDVIQEWKKWLEFQGSPLGSFLRQAPLFSLGAFLVLLAYLRRRRRDRALRAGWKEEPDDLSTEPAPVFHDD